MRGATLLIQSFIAVVLFFVMFFGIAFILNMLLRRTWLMSFIYPIIVLMMFDKLPKIEYIKRPIYAFSTAFSNMLDANIHEIIVLTAGFIGTIVSGIVIRYLRRSGYQMF